MYELTSLIERLFFRRAMTRLMGKMDSNFGIILIVTGSAFVLNYTLGKIIMEIRALRLEQEKANEFLRSIAQRRP